MNYSTFRLQNQAGRPAIFWEKETIPKKDKKFGYKTHEQRFPVRRFPNDRHHIETDLVSLDPEEPPPPPKPAKNFIKRNKQKVTAKKVEAPSTVTLTQEQLNAILRSVGKVAGGSENAVKITVDKNNDTKEILIESPRRHEHGDKDEDDDDYDDRKERRRKKKSERKTEDQGQSIYSFLDNKNKSKASSDSEGDTSDGSIELRRLSHKQSKRRKDRKSRRDDGDDEDLVRDKNRRNKNNNEVDDDDIRDKKTRKNRSNNLQDELDNEISNYNRQNRSKQRHDDDDYDSDSETRENRHRRSKKQDSDNENEGYDRSRKGDSIERKGRKSRKESKDRAKEVDIHNQSVNKEEEDLLPSPRDKVGLPIDLSWRHMTKAERRRLEAARQKLLDEEEKKDEERLKQLNARFDPDESFKRSPQRHPAPRSDPPATRQQRTERGRDTENSNFTDGNRRGRRSRSPSDHRSPDQSPDLPSYTTPDTVPKGPVSVPLRHMTLAEKKRLEWEKDRVESVALDKVGNYDPWGRPGAGAPLRSRSGHILADYKGRQEQLHNQTIPEEKQVEEKRKPAELETRQTERKKLVQGKSPPPAAPAKSAIDQNVPITMRSSFVIGQAAPDYDRLTSAKERERKKWLADLEKQIEEKRNQERRQPEVKEDYWATKLGQSHRAIPFPEQPKETGTAAVDLFSTSLEQGGGILALESNRATSAPENTSNEPQSFIRGQNVPVDPATRQELEGKRKQYLEHQAAVRAQVEEKERLKRMERERKMKEDMEEERKLQQERDSLKKQFEQEQQKIKQKEQQRQAQVNQLKAAMDEAQAKAMQEKYQRKMQHLEAGGHDTSKLREHLEGEITSRIEQLNTRRERDIQRAQQLLELRHWGISIPEEEDELNMSRLTKEDPNQSVQSAGLLNQLHQQTAGNSAPGSAKITPRDNDGMMLIEPSHVPGLDLGTPRTQVPAHNPSSRRDQGQSYHSHGQGHPYQGQYVHEPYMEDRVLTPSRFRHPSKPSSDPGSPRREFGTQTGKQTDSALELDGDNISRLLNPRLHRDDSEVNIEYRYERGKKVRVISAPKEALEKRSRKPKKEPHPPPSYREPHSPHEHHHEVRSRVEKEEERRKKRLEHQRRKGPVKPGSRPMWGYKNAEYKKPLKQSERDPFYEQKKQESEIRRLKREQKLLAMVEANKPVIPDYYVPPPRSSRSRSRSPFSDVEIASPREVRPTRRSKSHSPNRLVLQHDHDHSHGHGHHNEERSSERRRHQSRSPPPRQTSENSHVDNEPSRNHQKSPPVPSLRRKADLADADSKSRKGGKYRDADPLDVPVQNGDFVPFTRTIDVLDPTKAEEPVPLSREATRVANARRAYYEGLHPEKFGNRQYVFQDKHRVLPGTEDGKNPLMNPSLVLDHPTNRQDQILVQLSTLKQSLMQRQRELETFSPTDLVRMETEVHN